MSKILMQDIFDTLRSPYESLFLLRWLTSEYEIAELGIR